LISAISHRILGKPKPRAHRPGLLPPTADGVEAALKACRSDKELEKLQKWAGSVMAPLDAADLMQRAKRLPPQSRDWIEQIAAFGEFASVAPQAYRRHELHPNITIYTNESVSRERKNLVIGFSGAAGQLMFPTPAFLQYLDSDRYDVVILRDRLKHAYALGIPPYADRFWPLVEKLADELHATSYRRVYPFGTSIGGLPALRCGLLLKTESAAAAGAQFAYYPPHLERDSYVPSFDPLCDCNATTKTTLLCYHSTNYPADEQSADILERTLKIVRVPIEAPGHAFLRQLFERGQLRAFYDRVFGDDPAVEVPAARAKAG
jgi:hypothetical protein